jgi:transcriptional regulator with XRE-family HTH domain
MRESKWGDVIELKESILEGLAAEALIVHCVPLRGREVKFLRKVLGLTYSKFAAELGISPSAICKWEAREGERLHNFNEAALRAYFAEKLNVEISGKFSKLVAASSRPAKLVLKAS